MFAAVAASLLAATPAAAAHIDYYRASLTPLNNSGVGGIARFEHDTTANTLTVRVNASGLVPNTVHPQHIHGSFSASGCTDFAPASSPIAGACLDGSTAIESSIPTLAANDIDGDGFLETVEGAPAYGPIILNLADPAAGRAGLPGSFPLSDAEGNLDFTATYDLAMEDVDGTGLLFDTLNGIEHEVGDLFDLMQRVFVIHGTTAGPGGGLFEVTGSTAPGEFVALLPAAAGEIEKVPEPAAIGLFGMGLLGLAIARRRRRKV